jgi:hypothetical protein
VLSLCLCNKVRYDFNGVLLLLPALYLFLDMCLSSHVVHKGIQENKCGGKHTATTR